MFSGSVDAGFVLALPFHGDLEPDCVGVSPKEESGDRARSARRCRAKNARRRDVPDVCGRLASFSVEGRGSRALPRSSWGVHRYCRRSAFAVDNLTVDSRVIELSGSVDAGFFLVLPFHHGDLEPDCVGVSTKGGSLCAG